MMQQWQDFLQTQGAIIEAGQVNHFGSQDDERQQAVNGNVLADFSQFAVIKASGSEAQTFLQGQLTNDIRQVIPSKAQLSAWCSPKGRMLVSFYICQRHDDYYLFLPKDSMEAVFKRLKMFVLRADVQLEDVSDKIVCMGVAGQNSTQLLQNLELAIPESELFASTLREGLTIINLPAGSSPRYWIIHDDVELMQTLWTKLSASATPIGRDAWELLDILAAVPTINTKLSEEFVPQMTNWQALGGLNFKKGCYTGQEVVARMKYLGSLKRRMYLAKLDVDNTPEVGEKLLANTDNAGQVVNVQPHPDGGYALLAVLKIALENEAIHCESMPDKTLQIQDLPYNLE
ncbi:folate-binding protein YgfZ [Candidatus Albibeggiatoa sp. nov. NOAA]|uniref:CAF17-like 4Fe-4S cluster assembly/insertion protein YgfZ n=1 Tax=Candidatus Albibeggiatoa sp. nov. NOAA TaxID=3162724 RepID=UPI0032F47868|nr:folate-binding protein YgfZ [Thiotrichaceae bacterium]